MVGEDVIGLHREQAFEFTSGFPPASFALVDQREERAFIDGGVSQE